VIITEPVPTQADITVGTIFTGKVLALDISALTMGQVTATGVTATGVIPTGDMATGVIRAGVMATAVTRAGVTPTVVMAMEVIPTGVNPARATGNDLAGTMWFERLPGRIRAESLENTARTICSSSESAVRLTGCLTCGQALERDQL
jgi:hypothetical protein